MDVIADSTAPNDQKFLVGSCCIADVRARLPPAVVRCDLHVATEERPCRRDEACVHTGCDRTKVPLVPSHQKTPGAVIRVRAERDPWKVCEIAATLNDEWLRERATVLVHDSS